MKEMILNQNLAMGNFLYALGAGMARQLAVESPPAVVSFLQQSPSKEDSAKIFLGSPGAMFIVEFPSSRSALYQHTRHLTISSRLYHRADLRSFSCDMHWCVQTDAANGSILRAWPYLRAAHPEVAGTFESFIQHLVSYSLCRPNRLLHQQCREYLALLASVPSRSEQSNVSLIGKIGPNGELCLGSLDNFYDLLHS